MNYKLVPMDLVVDNPDGTATSALAYLRMYPNGKVDVSMVDIAGHQYFDDEVPEEVLTTIKLMTDGY